MNVKTYLVGGACRDIIMGVTPKDFDFIVVGGSFDDFSSWERVGKDFPVYLEPVNKWEVSLARTERKTGTGYKGFTVDCSGVTLEEDLARRDLTINAIAIEVDFSASITKGEPVTVGGFIDPFNGQEDIKNKVLRHTTEAFSEDPLRVLRVARFMARLEEFYINCSDHWEVAHETVELIKSIDLRELVPDRVWLETKKAISEYSPSAYFDYLSDWEPNLFPIWMDMWKTKQREDHHPEGNVSMHVGMVMDYARKIWNNTEITFAALCHDFGKPEAMRLHGNAHGHEKEGLPVIDSFCDKWKVPNSYRNLALQTCEFHTKVHGVLGRDTNDMMRPKSIMKMFEKTGVLTHTERFHKMLCVCEADSKGRGFGKEQVAEFEDAPYPQRQYLIECLEAVQNLNTKIISQKLLSEGKQGAIIGEHIRVARIDAIREVYRKWKTKIKN